MGSKLFQTQVYSLPGCADSRRIPIALPGNVSSLPCPGLDELSELARVRCKELRVVSARSQGEVQAVGVFSVEQMRMQGLSIRSYQLHGGDLCDYLCIYGDDPDSYSAILAAAKRDARCCGADVVFMGRVVTSSAESRGAFGRGAFPDRCHLFDVRGASEGWGSIYGRDSVRRHSKKAQRLPGYRVEHWLGRLEHSELLRLAELHRERWAWEGVKSRFEDPLRAREYGCYPGNKLLTRIWVGDEILACHYGMKYGEVLVWHTPVINVKFFDCSPLEVLLSETARYCEQSGIQVLDFGFGLEPYKARFGNGFRTVTDVLVPLTAVGWAAYVARRCGLGVAARAGVAAVRGHGRRIMSKVSGVIGCVEWREAPGGATGGPDLMVQEMGIVSSFVEFVEVARKHGFALQRYQYQRFRSGCSFAYLINENTVACHGWITGGEKCFIGEVARDVRVENRLLLFDFITVARFRGKGYFTALLRNLRRRFPGRVLAAYVSRSNKPSIRAMERAGFTKTRCIRGWWRSDG